jgi:hypothetical protein
LSKQPLRISAATKAPESAKSETEVLVDAKEAAPNEEHIIYLDCLVCRLAAVFFNFETW